ncbi:hypothetical protein KFL_000170310 [Klebsormidium nitens]|uniref:Sfi1 spindle body domain-containing protein n=1 Tax=Klebsormidium nitens TaxID=105231 RepID=A0A1Y1HJH2_KLENI|nr:hypothetical protein KFL_000170310 [Klebsormidium nitens]|eukprot:GAQ78685.1 hypothetical protein KFL_000170310 [Klebsormidium nitens]
MTIHGGDVAPIASSTHGSKQRAQVVVTKAPTRVKSGPLKGNLQLPKEPQGILAVPVKTGPKSQPVALGPTALRLIEEEKRAVRRHRKRLAKIVVDQWRYFAQKALLALEFRRRVLDRRKHQCWVAWREAVSTRRLKWTLQARAVARRRLTLERQVWARWVAHVQTQKQYQKAAARLLWMDARRLYSTAFTALKAHRTASLVKRQATAIALSHWRRATLSRFLASWRTASEAGQQKLAQRVEALQRWAAWRKRSVLNAWRQVIKTQKKYRGISQRLAEKRVKGQKAEVLMQWRAALVQKRADDAKLDRAYAFQYMYIVRTVIRWWALFVAQRKERRVEKECAMGSAAEHAERQLARRGYAAWRYYVEGRRRKVVALDMAEAANLLRIKTLVVRSWLKYHQRKQVLKDNTACAREFADFQLQYKAVLALKLHVQHKRSQEQHSIIAGRHWVRHMKRAAFTKWRSAAGAAVLEREATEEMLEEKKMVIVRAWQRDFSLSRALYGWRLYVASQRHSRHQNRKAAHFLRSKLFRKAFAALAAHVAKRRRKEQLKRSADEAYRKQLLRRMLCVHWREALSQAAAKREAYSCAEAFRNTRLERVSLEVWRVRTAKWALKSEAVRRAAVHHEGVLLGRALRAWKERLAFWRGKRTAEEKRVRASRRELGGLVAARVFAAWIEQHDRRLVRKLTSARARGHYREVYERRGLAVWRAWLVEQKRKRNAWQRAEQLSGKLLERRAVAAWREFVGVQRRKKERQAWALRVWSRRMQRLAFQAWTSYLVERRAKSAATTSADRLYQSRLVHVVASHWLAKTRRRQQLRLQIALEKQALTSIAQLARVAPYARRWRHLARMRRAEREGSRHRALLDGWAARNVSAGWRSLPKTGPFGGGMGLRRGDVSMTTAPAVQKEALAASATLAHLREVAQTPAKAVFAVKSDPPVTVASPPLNVPPAERTAEPASASVSARGTGPVSSVVERITASIASGASVLDALPPWARAHSRPPPRRPNHLLTAGKLRAPAGVYSATAADTVRIGSEAERPALDRRQRTGAEETVLLDSEIGRNRPGFGGKSESGAGSKSSVPRVSFSPTDHTPASSQATRAESFPPGGGGASDGREEMRTPEFVRPGGTDPGPLPEGPSAHETYRRVAVSRQLVLGASGEVESKVTGRVDGGTSATEVLSGRPFRRNVNILGEVNARGINAQERGPEDLFSRAVKPEDTRPVLPGAIVPVGGLTSNARVIAQEVTWMEAVLRDFDDLKAQSSECSKSLDALRKAVDPNKSTLELGGMGFHSGPSSAEKLGRAERIWELEQRHAALELRKKLQLPMVKAVAERIRSMALDSLETALSLG